VREFKTNLMKLQRFVSTPEDGNRPQDLKMDYLIE
jgi:hypothetical protein